MSSIEIRITALKARAGLRSIEESGPFYINSFSPISAAGILTQLREMSAIKTYVHEHHISANADRLPTILSPLNDLGEFSISLPSSENGTQAFMIRIINQSKQFGTIFSEGL